MPEEVKKKLEPIEFKDDETSGEDIEATDDEDEDEVDVEDEDDDK